MATRTYDPGQAILRKGESPAALHVVAAGKVEVDCARQRRRLGAGEVFGGHGQAAESYGMSVRAVTRVKLLVMEPDDVAELCEREPEFAARMAALVEKQLQRLAEIMQGAQQSGRAARE